MEVYLIGFFVGFEVQVGRVVVDGVEQYFVDEVYYGGVFGIVVVVVLVGVFCFVDIDFVEIDIVEVVEGVYGVFVKFFDGYVEFVVFYQQGFGGEVGVELDIGDCLMVGWVGEIDEQFVVVFLQW